MSFTTILILFILMIGLMRWENYNNKKKEIEKETEIALGKMDFLEEEHTRKSLAEELVIEHFKANPEEVIVESNKSLNEIRYIFEQTYTVFYNENKYLVELNTDKIKKIIKIK